MTKKIPGIKHNRIAIASDLHAGVHHNSHTWHEILHNWADWFISECNKHGIKDIVIPGDFFHHRNEINVHTMHTVCKLFHKFKDFNILGLVGNHDAYYKNNSRVHSLGFLNEWENVFIADEVTTFQAFGKNITLCPWGVNLEEIPESDIIFGHFELQGFHLNKSKVCTHGFTSEEILDKAPLIITGHFHIRDDRKYKKGHILYTGSAYELDWGDSGTSKGYYILDVETSNYDFYENNITPKHKKVFLSEISKTGITPEIKETFKDNWIKLYVDKKIKEDRIELLISKLNALKPINIKVEFDTFGDENLDIDYEFAGVDINQSIKEFVNELDIEYKDEVTSYILDLYKKVS
jgi:DNA repair exonuclease SbcCD nuclease subunit